MTDANGHTFLDLNDPLGHRFIPRMGWPSCRRNRALACAVRPPRLEDLWASVAMKVHSHPAAALYLILASSGGAIATAIYAQVQSSLNGWEALVIVVNAVLSVGLMWMKYRDQQISDVRHAETQSATTEARSAANQAVIAASGAEKAVIASTKDVEEVKSKTNHIIELTNSKWTAMEAVIKGLRDELRSALERADRAEGAAEQAKVQRGEKP